MFGINVTSNDGKRLLMSEASHLNFVGKAENPSDVIKLQGFLLEDSQIQIYEDDDEVRWYDLFISSPTPPLCFLYNGTQSDQYYSGITNVYEVSPGRYGIGIVQVYPNGNPLSTSDVEVYCFARPVGFSSNDGFVLKDRNGIETFHSDMEFLSVKGFATAPHWDNYSGLVYPHNISGLSKAAMPGFSNTKALNVTHYTNTSYGGCRTRYGWDCTSLVHCERTISLDCSFTWQHTAYTQPFRHILCVNNTGIMHAFAGEGAYFSNSNSSSFNWPPYSPITLPVIDGADYD